MRDYGYLPTLYGGTGPIVSVYLHLASEPGDGGRELPLRWRALRERLMSGGAEKDLLRPIDDVVHAANPVDRTLVVFARDGRVEHDELEDFDGVDAGVMAPVPWAVPLLRWRQQWEPYVAAVVDRTGADIAVCGAEMQVTQHVVVGPDDEIERNAPGGAAQARYQHRAEDSWAHNAKVVAREISRFAGRVDAGLVLVAGDVRAVQLVTDYLPIDVRGILRTVTSGLEEVSPGRPVVKREVLHRLVHEAAAATRSSSVRALEEAVGGSKAVLGVEDTVEALRRSSVDHLFVVHDPSDRRRAEISVDPCDLVPRRLTVGDADATDSVALGDALLRAAFAQSADVTVLGPGEARLPDGVGALVRF